MPESDAASTLRDADLADLFRTHRARLAGAVHALLGSSDDGDEVLQDSFMSALRAMRTGARPLDPSAWVFVITLNAAKDRLRRERRRPRRGLDEVSEMELRAKDRAPDERAEAAEAVEAAREAIARLAEPEKDVFLCRVSGGMSFEATAEALAIPIGTAKSRMRTALKRLRHELTDFAPWTRETRPAR